MTVARLVLGDQLSRDLAGLRDCDRDEDVVVMAEVLEEATYVRHHKQKIALCFAAMRAFASELEADGWRVDYSRLDDEDAPETIVDALAGAVERHDAEAVCLTAPGEYRLLQSLNDYADDAAHPVEIFDDDRFFATPERFRAWAEGRKSLRMEYFYRELRKETGLLMEGDEPAGGAWNFDKENRKRLPQDASPPKLPRFEPDETTSDVIALVAERFAGHFGELENFGWAVSRKDALKALDHFIEHALPRFGDYQDAMAEGEDFLYHSALSPYINLGLLSAREVCERAEAAYQAGDAPINAVEGFVRQILGWREYVRGVYWLKMPDYAELNALDAERPLPEFYWTGETRMNCLSEAISNTRRNAYAHHIQRLMLTGNFALLAGLDPKLVCEWYLIVYADAYEWVELPNTHGMALFADGGLLASKPYAASGAYVDRMSDYCSGCAYDVKQRTGEDACPFNYLYWDFLIRNEKRLADNPRLKFPYKNLEGFSKERIAGIQKSAKAFLAAL